MPKERLTKACTYMKSISGVQAAVVDQIFQDSLRLDSKTNLDELLKVKVGIFPSKNETEGWRKAVRALLVVQCVFDFRGEKNLGQFIAEQRKTDMAIATELEVQNQIKTRLQQGHAYQASLADRYYLTTQQNAASEAYLFQPLPHGGGGPRLLVPNIDPMAVCSGLWVEKPTFVDFKDSPATRGVYTTGATGGCIPVAFVYGGSHGGPIEAVHMHHMYGVQHMDLKYWTALKGARTDVPSAVVIYIYKADGGDRERSIEKIKLLKFPTNIATFYHDDQGKLAIDKWGRFGSIDGELKVK